MADWSPSAASAERAAVFLGVLTSRSPSHDGAPLRQYEIRDIDYDGRFEVLEHRSDLEERATGYLSIEWAPPTWIGVLEASKHAQPGVLEEARKNLERAQRLR